VTQQKIQEQQVIPKKSEPVPKPPKEEPQIQSPQPPKSTPLEEGVEIIPINTLSQSEPKLFATPRPEEGPNQVAQVDDGKIFKVKILTKF
jgi:hypothetical protein